MSLLDALPAEPAFPPLLTGRALEGAADPFDTACAAAAMGCDAGIVFHNLQSDRMRAAVVFAPEVPLRRAMAALPVCAVGFQNALGALAPPEVAVHLDWNGGLRVNGARCGRLRAATWEAAAQRPESVPDWLCIGLEVPFHMAGAAPGLQPDRTALHEEGCVEVAPLRLLESWSRHMLTWMNRWSEGEVAALHAEWRGLAHGIGEAVAIDGRRGTWLGIDEDFGMILRDDDGTHLIPLTCVLERRP